MEEVNKNTNIIFAHVPKCAGSSVVATLRNCRSGITAIKWGQIDETWKNFMRSGKRGQFVYGHLRARHLEELEGSNMDYRLITFLRHPVERLISVYRYNASPASPHYQRFIKNNPDFEKWVLNYFRNDIASFIAGEMENVEQYVKIVRERFDFIGFQESYTADIRRLCTFLGLDYAQRERRENVTQNTPYNGFNVSNELRQRIANGNPLDVAAYEMLKNYE